MKRLFVLALAALVTTGAMAQGTFTIRRPLDGSTVREVVKVRIPKNSINDDNGYIGVYVNGKFLEATLPEIEGDDYVYNLDTQARGLEDGPAKIECVLFMDVNGKPQIVNKSSINVVIDNKTSIKIPEDGLKLRYKFTPGVEHVYDFTFNQEVGMVSQAQAQLGSRAPMMSSDDMKIRVLYATDNVYPTSTGKDSLLRIQLLPDKGKDYTSVIPLGDTKSMVIKSDQMLPLYLRISDVGREVFGALPIYFGMDGKNGALPTTQYYPILPLPVLPTKTVKPGDVWNAAYLFGQVDKDKAHEQNSFTQSVPARGEFEDVTWFKGMRCVKVKTIIALGPEILKNVKNLNQLKGEASNVKLEGTYWFAIDKGAIVRMESTITQESLIDVGTASGGTGGGDNGGGNSGLKKGGPVGTGGDDPGAMGGSLPGQDGLEFEIHPTFDKDGNASIFQSKGGRNRGGVGGIGGVSGGNSGDANGGGGAPGDGRGGRFGQSRGNSGGGPRKMVMRVRVTYVADLEV